MAVVPHPIWRTLVGLLCWDSSVVDREMCCAWCPL